MDTGGEIGTVRAHHFLAECATNHTLFCYEKRKNNVVSVDDISEAPDAKKSHRINDYELIPPSNNNKDGSYVDLEQQE
jgi:hypothetical protein